MDASEAKEVIRTATQILFSDHARQRMRERGVTRADVRFVLENVSQVCEGDGEDKWVVTGRDLDEEDLTVVVVIEVLLTKKSRSFVVTLY